MVFFPRCRYNSKKFAKVVKCLITSIKLNSCTPFCDAEFRECKKVNFIFGANGSGKSTVSLLLSGVNDDRLAHSSICWDNPSSHEMVYVYNRDFRRNNFRQFIPGIFTVGNATSGTGQLEDLKSELIERQKEEGRISGDIDKKTKEKSDCEGHFMEDVWEQIFKKNEEDFQKAFEGFRNSKKRFFTELKSRIHTRKGRVCERLDLLMRAKTLYSEVSVECDKFAVNVQAFLKHFEEIRANSIWSRVIVGNLDVDISALIEDLDNSSWVEHGRRYIRENSNICPFCQKETITDEFRGKLESFFDTSYKRNLAFIENLLNDYLKVVNEIVSIFKAAIDKKTAVRIGQLDINIYSSKCELLISLFRENEMKMKLKMKEPNLRIEILDVSHLIIEISDLLSAADTIIDQHNELVKYRAKEVRRLTDDIWTTCICEANNLIEMHQRKIDSIEKAIEGLKHSLTISQEHIKDLKEEIVIQDSNLTGIQTTIDEINNALAAYGFTNFSIQPAGDKKNCYRILRDDGTFVNDTLSEGEETFLTFLYFMQMSKGSMNQNDVSSKKILVFDDPVSSLDSTILYVVGAMVKELCQNVRDNKGDVTQVFIFTHNLFFHREASFVGGRKRVDANTNYWIIRKNNGVSEIQSYGTENPISSSYELLWKELQDNKNASHLSIQNVMRRIIENYFTMLGGINRDDIIKSFETAEEKIVVESLFQWMNEGSHIIPDDAFVEPYTDIVQRYKKIFRQIFDKSGHIAHYNMMMGLKSNEN